VRSRDEVLGVRVRDLIEAGLNEAAGWRASYGDFGCAAWSGDVPGVEPSGWGEIADATGAVAVSFESGKPKNLSLLRQNGGVGAHRRTKRCQPERTGVGVGKVGNAVLEEYLRFMSCRTGTVRDAVVVVAAYRG